MSAPAKVSGYQLYELHPGQRFTFDRAEDEEWVCRAVDPQGGGFKAPEDPDGVTSWADPEEPVTVLV